LAATIGGTRRGMHHLADRVNMSVEDLAAGLMLTPAVTVELAGVVAWAVASGYVTTVRCVDGVSGLAW
jgi:hypothetical protein